MSFFQTKKLNVETLGEYLRDTRIALRLILPQVTRLSQIPEKFLRSLEEGDYDHLPADVYVKGFLKTLAAIYRVPSQVLLDQFEQERGIARNLKNNPLGTNRKRAFRFSVPLVTPRTFTIISVALLTVLSLGYLIWQVRSVSAPPELTLEYPESNLSIATRSLLLRGGTDPGSRVYVNNQEILVEDSGSFQKILNLSDGTNNLLIRSQNKFGRSQEIQRQVVVAPAGEISTSTVPVVTDKIVLEIVIGPESPWITAVADGQEVLNRIVNSGETLNIEASSRLVLGTGDAGSTRVYYNGQDLGVLGRAGESLSNIVFTR